MTIWPTVYYTELGSLFQIYLKMRVVSLLFYVYIRVNLSNAGELIVKLPSDKDKNCIVQEPNSKF